MFEVICVVIEVTLLPLVPSVAARSAKSVAENMEKLQEDRDFLERVVNDMVAEVAENGTFTSLSDALQQYWQHKEGMETEILE